MRLRDCSLIPLALQRRSSQRKAQHLAGASLQACHGFRQRKQDAARSLLKIRRGYRYDLTAPQQLS